MGFIARQELWEVYVSNKQGYYAGLGLASFRFQTLVVSLIKLKVPRKLMGSFDLFEGFQYDRRLI